MAFLNPSLDSNTSQFLIPPSLVHQSVPQPVQFEAFSSFYKTSQEHLTSMQATERTKYNHHSS
uniref:Uncharacterized protein n=1 Tax=Arundo donax TaxID=35708 RepID=A0A0A8YM22_ARUDO